MTEHNVIAVDDCIAKAEVAVYALEQEGFPAKQLSLVSPNLGSGKSVHGYILVDDDKAKRGASSGA